jgi:hypothetical protein
VAFSPTFFDEWWRPKEATRGEKGGSVTVRGDQIRVLDSEER